MLERKFLLSLRIIKFSQSQYRGFCVYRKRLQKQKIPRIFCIRSLLRLTQNPRCCENLILELSKTFFQVVLLFQVQKLIRFLIRFLLVKS